MNNPLTLLIIPEIINVLIIKSIFILYLIYCLRIFKKTIKSAEFWITSVTFLILMRFSDFNTPFSMNPDEEQWIICANSFADSPSDWLYYFFVTDYSRFFTFLPLSIFSFIFDGASYIHARIIQQAFFLVIVYYQWKVLKEFSSEKIAFLSSALLLIIFSTSNHYDLINYNSEMPSVALISIITYIYLIKIKNNISNFYIIILGFTISLLPFTKEQTTLIAASIGIFIFIDFIRNAQIKNAIIFALSAILFPIMAIGIFSYIYEFNTLIANLQLGLKYSENASDISPENSNLIFKFYRAFFCRVINATDFVIPLFFVLLSIILYFILLIKKKMRILKEDFFQIIIFISILYTIFGIKSPIYHYFIFLFIPISWYFNKLLVIGVYVFKLNTQFFFFSIALLSVLPKNEVFFNRERKFHLDFTTFYKNDKGALKKQYFNFISRKYNAEGKGTIIWGFNLECYIQNKFKRSSSSLYSQFAMRKTYASNKYVINKYILDLIHFKPYSFIDFKNGYKYWRIKKEEQTIIFNSPQLHKHLNEKYKLVESNEDFDLYIIKDSSR